MTSATLLTASQANAKTTRARVEDFKREADAAGKRAADAVKEYDRLSRELHRLNAPASPDMSGAAMLEREDRRRALAVEVETARSSAARADAIAREARNAITAQQARAAKFEADYATTKLERAKLAREVERLTAETAGFAEAGDTLMSLLDALSSLQSAGIAPALAGRLARVSNDVKVIAVECRTAVGALGDKRLKLAAYGEE